MDADRIVFIICSNNETFLRECLAYIGRLEVPEGKTTEVRVIKGASSMLSGYSEACRQTDALYRVFLHQDVFILNKRFISDIISIFSSDPEIGMIGVAGCRRIPEDLIMWSGDRLGSLFVRGREHDYEDYRYDPVKDGYDEAEATDGLLMAVKGDVPFREDIFDGWDFYDLSMSEEMRRKGKKIVIPAQRLPWCLHDDGGVLSMLNYDRYRQRAMKLYGRPPLTIALTGGFVTLDEFIKEMTKGTDAYIVDTKNPEKTLLPLIDRIDSETVVITFNNTGSGYDLWKQRNVRLYNILVDHPAHFLEAISADYFPGYHAVLIDRGHRRFLREVFPNIPSAFCFMPHGGSRADSPAFPSGVLGGDEADTPLRHQEKDIDILYAGGFRAEEDINFPPPPFGDPEAFYDHVIGYYERESYVEAQDAVNDLSSGTGDTLTPAEIAVMTNYAVKSVEAWYVAQRRQNLIKHLAGQGLTVHIIGNEVWRKTAAEYPGNIIYEGMKTPEECLGFISRAKVLINDLPYFAEGAHERVFNGMLNGTVVLSNESRYLEERFKDGESILFWDGRDLREAEEKIRKVLSDDEYRLAIVEKAFSLTKRDTWRDRFDLCITGSL